MTNQLASLEYRRAATQQASVVGLVIALHDTLIGNLTRAAEAMDRSDIPTRCNELIHGFKVLTQLEAMLDMKNGGQAAINIRRFYTHVRGQMLSAQFKLSPDILRRQIQTVLDIRQTWEKVDNAPPVEGRGDRSRWDNTDSLMRQSVGDVEAYASFSCSG